jgi:hypothetical protein
MDQEYSNSESMKKSGISEAPLNGLCDREVKKHQ